MQGESNLTPEEQEEIRKKMIECIDAGRVVWAGDEDETEGTDEEDDE